MESNGLEGHVMVSETTKNLLEHCQDLNYDFTLHTVVKIEKLNCEIKGYLI